MLAYFSLEGRYIKVAIGFQDFILNTIYLVFVPRISNVDVISGFVTFHICFIQERGGAFVECFLLARFWNWPFSRGTGSDYLFLLAFPIMLEQTGVVRISKYYKIMATE